MDTEGIFIYPLVDTLGMYICFKCNHQWYQRSEIPPRRCSNHSCRTTTWGAPLPPNPLEEEVTPLVVPVEVVSKKEELSNMQNLINSIHAKTEKKFVPAEPVVEDGEQYLQYE